MPLGPKVQIQQDILGTSVWVTDKTGVQDPNNTGGWGTPNPDINVSALGIYIQRNTLVPAKLANISAQVVFDAGAANTKVNTFELTYLGDGHHTITMFRFRVSNDQVNDLEGVALAEGDYYWYTTTSELRRIVLGVGTVVTDLSAIVGNTNVPQVTCELIFFVDLSKKSNEIYWDYKELRGSNVPLKNQKGETKTKFEELLVLREDLTGADWAFHSGLLLQSQDIVDTLITDKEIT